MRQRKNYNWLALLGMFVVLVLVIYALSVYGGEDSVIEESKNSVANEVEDQKAYTPELKKVESDSTNEDGVGENDQENAVTEGEGSADNESFSSTDASLEENSNASTTYEDFEEGNFDEKD